VRIAAAIIVEPGDILLTRPTLEDGKIGKRPATEKEIHSDVKSQIEHDLSGSDLLLIEVVCVTTIS